MILRAPANMNLRRHWFIVAVFVVVGPAAKQAGGPSARPDRRARLNSLTSPPMARQGSHKWMAPVCVRARAYARNEFGTSACGLPVALRMPSDDDETVGWIWPRLSPVSRRSLPVLKLMTERKERANHDEDDEQLLRRAQCQHRLRVESRIALSDRHLA